MSDHDKFRIAIVGSGPIGKLIISSVTPHPRVEYTQCEQETLPLRPSFGISVSVNSPVDFHSLTRYYRIWNWTANTGRNFEVEPYPGSGISKTVHYWTCLDEFLAWRSGK